MAVIPILCNDCGRVWGSDRLVVTGPDTRLSLTVGKMTIRPCPYCGGTGEAPNGLYEFTGETVNIATNWPADRLQNLIAALEAARARGDRQAAEEAIRNDPELASFLSRISPLQDGPTFWAFIAALLAALALILAHGDDPHTTVNQQTVIEQIVGTRPEPQKPHESPP